MKRKKFRTMLFILSMETPCLLPWVTSGLVNVENEAGLLPAKGTLKDSAPIAE